MHNLDIHTIPGTCRVSTMQTLASPLQATSPSSQTGSRDNQSSDLI